MGRMIDAEKFKEHFCEENCGNRRCRDEFDKCTFIMALEQEPTAYEPDKVVEQLEEYREEMEQFKRGGMLSEMIEVVKEGGVDG